jgi:hypothetical protein
MNECGRSISLCCTVLVLHFLCFVPDLLCLGQLLSLPSLVQSPKPTYIYMKFVAEYILYVHGPYVHIYYVHGPYIHILNLVQCSSDDVSFFIL